MYKHILIPIDGSEQAGKALENAIGLARALSADVRLTVLHVNPALTLNEPVIGMDLEQALEEEGKHILEPAAVKLRAAGFAFDTLTADGDPAAVIVRTAKDADADLIVMGTRGVGIVSELLLGSVSHGVVQHAHCPVLLVK
ncbi:universal stress protein [Paenibacillus sacheonensis]|uniref:Universal stress protein n=1 Tax=Paenibacillus sacheonensis TaxID=742054 RepID=A0A7X5BXN3_9BACL|nr:universal stress protein [Paenibacillus sacheonensis]MBM7567808.1 nucleotide-binding universal stress UspA family protein [Paenibacillus sacheonensis]NBC70698.1 universal stress protein [Paenibacillus sacheonensis]